MDEPMLITTVSALQANNSRQCERMYQPGSLVDLVAYGVIYPILAVIVLFTNVSGIIVLIRIRNFTQTNMLLLSIFTVDLITTTSPFPKFFVDFTVKQNTLQTPFYPWCYVSTLFFPTIPIISNNISIWLVLVLTIQRFVCVWKRDVYDKVFSRRNIIIIIIFICVITTAFHAINFVENYRQSLTCTAKDGSKFSICDEEATLIPLDMVPYVLSTYYLSRIVVFHLIPIIAIAVSNMLLIRILVKAEKNRKKLFSAKKENRSMSTVQDTLKSLVHQTLTLEKIDESENSMGKNVVVRTPSIRKPTKLSSVYGNYLTAQVSGSSAISRSSIQPGEQRRSTNTNRLQQRAVYKMATTTHMLMVISTIYLFQHVCNSVLFIIGIVCNLVGVSESNAILLFQCITIQNLIYWVGMPANFLLCMYVQAPFRDMFVEIYRIDEIQNYFAKRSQSRQPIVQEHAKELLPAKGLPVISEAVPPHQFEGVYEEDGKASPNTSSAEKKENDY